MGAVVSVSFALLLVIDAGLPMRAEYTGKIAPGELPIAPELNSIAPPFELNSLDDRIVNLDDLRGKPVVINFWATWCEPCKAEMPTLQTIYDDYKAKGLHILAVNLGEPSGIVAEWVQALHLNFDILMDRNQQISSLYWLRGQPSTYVVSPSGVITQIYYGPVDVNALRNALAPYLVS